jgi:hypothetical protein
VDNQNSQKRSPRSSEKSKQDSTGTPGNPQTPHRSREEDDQFFDRSFDHVARVRAAKEAAQREMEEFGDVSEYDVTIIQGQLKEEPNAAAQPSLDFDEKEEG